MTASLRIRIGLAKLTFAAMASTSLLALAIVGAQPALAQSHRPVALTGTVSSQQEGKMEGVVVSAKRRGSTIMVSVSTNAQGQYAFPQDRLAPGIYDITMRAVGYTLKLTSAVIQSGEPAHLDLQLAKAAPDALALQLTNSEWMQSAPGTPTEKIELLRCLDCHGLQRPMFSKENAEGMAQTVERMGLHTANASPNFPFFLQTASVRLTQPPTKVQEEFGKYLASINLSSGKTLGV